MTLAAISERRYPKPVTERARRRFGDLEVQLWLNLCSRCFSEENLCSWGGSALSSRHREPMIEGDRLTVNSLCIHPLSMWRGLAPPLSGPSKGNR